MRGSSSWNTTRISFDSCTERHRSSLQRLKHMLCEYTSQEFCRSHAAYRSMKSPDPSILFLSFRFGRTFRRMNLLAWKHIPGLQFPLEDQTMLHTARLHALTMEKVLVQIRHLSLSSRNPLAHISISLHFRSIVEPNLWVESICWEVCQSLWPKSTASDLSSAEFLVHLRPWLCRRVVHRSKLLHMLLEMSGQSSAKLLRWHQISDRSLHELSKVLATRAFFGTFFIINWFQWKRCRWSSLKVIFIHLVRQAIVVCDRGCFLISLGWDLLNSNSDPAFECLEHQFRVLLPPLMLFGSYLTKHLDMFCIHRCVTSLDQESRECVWRTILSITFVYRGFM